MQKKRARERIIMFLCIISLLFTPVLAASQSNAMRVSLDLKSATVKEFFDAVKVQTGLNFIYSTEQVKNMPRITIQSNSQPISEVLNKVLANTGYSYEIEGNIVTIVYQQPKENVRTATGVVVDEGGLPLPGAYIKLSKTEHSTITDNEGKFSINLFHQKEPVLIVSYLGMIVQEVKVAGTKPMTIVMKSDVKSIDEVVVTGYQEIDRRKLASSISSIKGADLIGGEYLSIDKMLQGRLPGVAVMNMSSKFRYRELVFTNYVFQLFGIEGTITLLIADGLSDKLDRNPDMLCPESLRKHIHIVEFVVINAAVIQSRNFR